MLFKSGFVSLTKWDIAKLIIGTITALICIYALRLGMNGIGATDSNLKYQQVTNYSGIMEKEKISGTLYEVPVQFRIQGKTQEYLKKGKIEVKTYYAIKTDTGKYIAFYPGGTNDKYAFADQYVRYCEDRNYYKLDYNGTVARITDAERGQMFYSLVIAMGDELNVDDYLDWNGALLPFSRMEEQDYEKINSLISDYKIVVEDSIQKPGIQATVALFGAAVCFLAFSILFLRKILVRVAKAILYHLGLFKVEVQNQPDEPLDTNQQFTDTFDDENYFFDDRINEKPYVRSMPENAPKYEADEFYTGEPNQDGFFYVGTQPEQKNLPEETENPDGDDDNYRRLRY